MRAFLAGFGLAFLSDLEAQQYRAEYAALVLEGKNEDLDNITSAYNAMLTTQKQLVAKIAQHEATIQNVSNMYAAARTVLYGAYVRDGKRFRRYVS